MTPDCGLGILPLGSLSRSRSALRLLLLLMPCPALPGLVCFFFLLVGLLACLLTDMLR